MGCNVEGYWVSGFCPLSAITNNKFLKLDLFLFLDDRVERQALIGTQLKK
jgi:hypothetical protein